MGRSYSGHVPIRVPDGWNGQGRAMVIQLNNIVDDLYLRIEKLKKELEELKNSEGDEEDG